MVDEIQVHTSRCGPFDAALRQLASRTIDVTPLIAARYALQDGPAALSRAGHRGTLKVLLEMV